MKKNPIYFESIEWQTQVLVMLIVLFYQIYIYIYLEGLPDCVMHKGASREQNAAWALWGNLYIQLPALRGVKHITIDNF